MRLATPQIPSVFALLGIKTPYKMFKSFCDRYGIMIPPREMSSRSYSTKLGEYETVITRESLYVHDHINILVRCGNINFQIQYRNVPPECVYYWGQKECSVFYFQKKISQWSRRQLSIFRLLPLPISEEIQKYLPLGLQEDTCHAEK
jgi:hypothetical protein